MNRDFSCIYGMIVDFIRSSKESDYAFYGFFIHHFRTNIDILNVAPELASYIINAPIAVKQEFLEVFDLKNELNLGICENCGAFFNKGFEVREQQFCSIECVKTYFTEIAKDVERNPTAYRVNL